MVFTRHHGAPNPLIGLKEEAVRLGASLMYSGIVLERKETMFGVHLRAVAEKIQRVISAVKRLKPNVSGPNENRRHLFVSIVHSVLCGAPT